MRRSRTFTPRFAQLTQRIGKMKFHCKSGGTKNDAIEDGATALRPFMLFITSMWDHLQHMTPSQVCLLFLLLFAVGGGGDTEIDADVGGGCFDGRSCYRYYDSEAFGFGSFC